MKWFSRFFGFISHWFRKMFGGEYYEMFPVSHDTPTERHGIHSKRPYYLKAELMDAAQAKRLRKNAKRLAEVSHV